MALIDLNTFQHFGLSEIDNQHFTLIKLINKLYDEIEGKTITVYSVKKSIDELFKYAALHFSTEEKYFNLYGYNQADTHKEEHRQFIKSAEELKSQYQPGKKDIALALLNFIVDWYLEHINNSDRKYVQFFIDKGLK